MKEFATLRLGTLELDTRRALAEVCLVEALDESTPKNDQEKASLEIQAIEFRLESPESP